MSELSYVARLGPMSRARAALRLVAVAVLVGACTGAHASAGWNLASLQALQLQSGPLGLEHAWNLALANAPEYQAALSGRAAAALEHQKGRAQLLPVVQAGYYRGRISGMQRALNVAAPALAESSVKYDSNTAYVQLRQPLIDYGRYSAYQAGQQRAAVGEAEYRVHTADLAARLVDTYLNAVHAQELLQLRRAHVVALQALSAAVAGLQARDEASSIDLGEIEARLSLARSDQISAQYELNANLRALKALVGEDVAEVASAVTLQLPEPSHIGTLPEWLETARQQAPYIGLARAREALARAQVSVAASGHLPRLEAIAGWTKADSENLSTLSQRYNTFTVGLNLEIPLTDGGRTTAAHAEARAQLQQAEHELAAAQEAVFVETTREYKRMRGGLDRVAALSTAVASALKARSAAETSYRLGAASVIDVLKAEQRLLEARQQLMEARVEAMRGVAMLQIVASGAFTL